MNKERLFVGSCFGLVATAVCFAVVGAIMGVLKEKFVLSNEQVGYIGGAAIWGFTVSIFILGPLCDVLGMRNLLRFAVLCHGVGALLMIFARVPCQIVRAGRPGSYAPRPPAARAR
jgi:MFS family permease